MYTIEVTLTTPELGEFVTIQVTGDNAKEVSQAACEARSELSTSLREFSGGKSETDTKPVD